MNNKYEMCLIGINHIVLVYQPNFLQAHHKSENMGDLLLYLFLIIRTHSWLSFAIPAHYS